MGILVLTIRLCESCLPAQGTEARLFPDGRVHPHLADLATGRVQTPPAPLLQALAEGCAQEAPTAPRASEPVSRDTLLLLLSSSTRVMLLLTVEYWNMCSGDSSNNSIAINADGKSKRKKQKQKKAPSPSRPR